MKKLVKHAIRKFFKFQKNSTSGIFLVKHANWNFFEIRKISSFGHNFLKSAKCPHQVIFPNLKNFLIRHFSNSTGNFAKSKKLPLWAICQNRKHVRIRKFFRIWQISPLIIIFNNKPIGASPGCDYVLTRMVLQIILYSKW